MLLALILPEDVMWPNGPFTLKEPEISADPVKGKPVPVGTFKANEDVVANEALVASSAKEAVPKKLPEKLPEMPPLALIIEAVMLVTTKLSVISKLPEIPAEPVNGKPTPLPATIANEAVVANEAVSILPPKNLLALTTPEEVKSPTNPRLPDIPADPVNGNPIPLPAF